MYLAITVIRHQTSFPPGERSAFACVLLRSLGAKSAQCSVIKSKHKGAGYFTWDSHSQALWVFSWSEAKASDTHTQLCVYCKKGERAAWEMLSTSPQIVPNSREHVCSASQCLHSSASRAASQQNEYVSLSVLPQLPVQLKHLWHSLSAMLLLLLPAEIAGEIQ